MNSEKRHKECTEATTIIWYEDTDKKRSQKQFNK